MERIYQYGDVVVITGKEHLGEAAIVARNKSGLYALEFAHPNGKLHNCGGLTDDHCGYWALQEELELLQEADEPLRCRLTGDSEGDVLLTELPYGNSADLEWEVALPEDERPEDAEEEDEAGADASAWPGWSLLLTCRDGQVHGMLEHDELGPLFHARVCGETLLEDVVRAVLAMLDAKETEIW